MQFDSVFDLCALPFSGKDSNLAIREDGDTRSLYLYWVRTTQPNIERDRLIRVVPVIDNKDDTKWVYSSDFGKLTLQGVKGVIEFCFERGDVLRIRGRGEALRWYCDDLKIYENAAPREDGSLELAYEILGKMLVVPLKGSLHHTAFWNHNDVKTNAFIVEFIPDSASGEFEAAVHTYYSNGVKDASYPDFDDCCTGARADFERFASITAGVEPDFEGLAREAAYTLYTLQMPPEGLLKASAIYASKQDTALAIGWQQALSALALAPNTERAFQSLMSPFSAQSEDGQIPNGAACAWIDWLSCGLPIQGFILKRLWNNGAVFDEEQTKTLYSALGAYARWYKDNRVHTTSGLPVYFHPQECGFADSTAFVRGLPLAAPDLAAWLALLFEAVAELAERSGIQSESDYWKDASKTVIDTLVRELWRDDHFICKNMRTGYELKANSALRLIPIILGKRLPDDIADALAAEIGDPSTYLTPGGVAGEKLGSQEFSLSRGSLLRGGIVPALQLAFAVGLLEVGKEELAREIVERTLVLAEKVGLGDSIPPYANDPWTGKALWTQNEWNADELNRRKDLLRKEKREPRDTLHWTAAGAAGILALLKLFL